MSSSIIGACPHHSDSRCPRISESSARRSAYSTSGVSETLIEAAAISLSICSPHPEEREVRLEGWATGLMVRDGACTPPHHEGRERKSQMPDFIGHIVERRVPVDLGFRRLEHH